MKPQTKKTTIRFTTLALSLFALSACNMNQTTNPLDTASFREGRFEQMQKIQGFESCRDEGLAMDSHARSRGSAGAYLNSAKVLESCTADLGNAASKISLQERMRVSALAIVDYLRGGDMEKARMNFEKFQAVYADQDLYFSDGSSFIATTDALLGRSGPMTYGEFASLNINDQVKSEMRRINHWKNK